MFDVAVLPYRTMNFARQFGFTVRDLMMLQVLEANDRVAVIHWLERPSLPIEPILTRSAAPAVSPKTRVHSSFAWNPLPAFFQRRLWPQTSMSGHNKFLRSMLNTNVGSRKVLLDFHPFFIPDDKLFASGDLFYWYDLIDNFAIHNVFSEKERSAVEEKYAFVREHANLVTGVTQAALQAFPNGTVLPNRLVRAPHVASQDRNPTNIEPLYDLGFTGFITDKFDVPFIRRLAKMGFTILIRGKAYHQHVADELRSISGVTLGNHYHASEQTDILRQFRIGLIPYRPEKSHDESPIKLVQYLASLRPALISKHFGELDEEFSRWVVNYTSLDDNELMSSVERLILESGGQALQHAVDRSPSLFWDTQLDDVLLHAEKQ